jgi:hypothetical protein
MRADAHDLDRLAGLMLADNGDDLRGADVEADNEVFRTCGSWRSQGGIEEGRGRSAAYRMRLEVLQSEFSYAAGP